MKEKRNFKSKWNTASHCHWNKAASSQKCQPVLLTTSDGQKWHLSHSQHPDINQWPKHLMWPCTNLHMWQPKKEKTSCPRITCFLSQSSRIPSIRQKGNNPTDCCFFAGLIAFDINGIDNNNHSNNTGCMCPHVWNWHVNHINLMIHTLVTNREWHDSQLVCTCLLCPQGRHGCWMQKLFHEFALSIVLASQWKRTLLFFWVLTIDAFNLKQHCPWNCVDRIWSHAHCFF